MQACQERERERGREGGRNLPRRLLRPNHPSVGRQVLPFHTFLSSVKMESRRPQRSTARFIYIFRESFLASIAVFLWVLQESIPSCFIDPWRTDEGDRLQYLPNV